MAVPRSRAAAMIESWFSAALAAVEPTAAVEAALAADDSGLTVAGRRQTLAGRLVLVAVGKAAVPMARGAVAVCGDRIEGGIVITKEGQATAGLPGRFAVRAASHPIPDERGVAATREALRLVRGLSAGDVLLTLISGGGSALLEAPRAPLSLADLAASTDLLLRAGAPIQDLNAVRWCLSDVKAGGLRRAAGEATVVTLILSDVLGNDHMVIASGPTVAARRPSRAGARRVIERYALKERLPAAVAELLARPEENDSATIDDDEHGDEGDRFVIVGDNRAALAAAVRAAERDGLRVATVWREREGEAADLGRAWVAACRAAPASVDVLLGGGEATVAVRGDGLGGRNTEFALAGALALEEAGEAGLVIASLATDGEDALTGVAGAVADGETVARAARAGVDAEAALARNDSFRVFEAAGGLVRPGPTGTNVNDLYFGVRVS